jgi:hypothetical protein
LSLRSRTSFLPVSTYVRGRPSCAVSVSVSPSTRCRKRAASPGPHSRRPRRVYAQRNLSVTVSERRRHHRHGSANIYRLLEFVPGAGGAPPGRGVGAGVQLVQPTSGAAPTACAGTFARAVWLTRANPSSRSSCTRRQEGGAHTCTTTRRALRTRTLRGASPDQPCVSYG